MALRPVDISLAIQSSPQIAAIGNSSAESRRVAGHQEQAQFAQAVEEREQRVEEPEPAERSQPADEEGKREQPAPKRRRRGAFAAAPAPSESDLIGDDGQHLIDVSV
jgi:hypothetical protein